jgi:hypothetical protein
LGVNARPAKKNPEESPRGFLPRPLLRADKIPAKKKLVSVLRKSISPENSFRKTESALKPRHTARILGGQNPKKKNVLSILEKIHPRENQEEQGTLFLFGVAE